MQVKNVVDQVDQSPSIFVGQWVELLRHKDIHHFHYVKIYFDVSGFWRNLLELLKDLARDQIDVLFFLHLSFDIWSELFLFFSQFLSLCLDLLVMNSLHLFNETKAILKVFADLTCEPFLFEVKLLIRKSKVYFWGQEHYAWNLVHVRF